MQAQDNATAFLLWYEPLHERFARYCASRATGLDSAEDIAQDAILSALEQWDRLEDKSRLLPYMIGIVNNRVRNALRSARVHRCFLEERGRILSERLPARQELALDLQYLLRAIDRLPEASREALLLSTVSGFSLREVAEIQNATEGAVKVRISRARKQLRETFNEDGKPLSIGERLQIYASILL
ncbi:RNA polymerase sigma factor [Lewinella sp. IMCC34191]|uniref:RNA polymerase sigma factor n=1 Tax=Lewinella sp. IMCC34191 TaxID=2259172 RepID=UPI000E24E8B4|nr:RNA polymerase sigma factor [Lewinella sp. IMCC34191]